MSSSVTMWSISAALSMTILTLKKVSFYIPVAMYMSVKSEMAKKMVKVHTSRLKAKKIIFTNIKHQEKEITTNP